MAIATLDKLANNGDVYTGVVKIRKGQAVQLMMNAGDMPSLYRVRYCFLACMPFASLNCIMRPRAAGVPEALTVHPGRHPAPP